VIEISINGRYQNLTNMQPYVKQETYIKWEASKSDAFLNVLATKQNDFNSMRTSLEKNGDVNVKIHTLVLFCSLSFGNNLIVFL